MYLFIFLCYVFAYAARGDHDGNKTITQFDEVSFECYPCHFILVVLLLCICVCDCLFVMFCSLIY